MWKGKKVSVIMPAYNEEANIKNAITEFSSEKIVDEIIAIDNNSTDKTKKLILNTNAKYVSEQKQGYGHAILKGLKEAKGFYVITVEPDNSFSVKDLHRLLEASEKQDVVFGTRTNKRYIQKNAKMNSFLRIGNCFIANIINILFNTKITDVGCTYKLIKKPALNKILNKLIILNSSFSPHFIIVSIKNKLSYKEIPVIYKNRIGNSKITSSFQKSFLLGIKMIILIISSKFNNS